MRKCIFAVVIALGATLLLPACGGYKSNGTNNSGLKNRVVASQSVSSTSAFGELIIINGSNDSRTATSPLSAGSSPGLMVTSPSRNILAAFDASSNSVFAVDTTKETSLGQVHLAGPSFSMAVPTADPVAYAAVPMVTVTGFPVQSGVQVLNLSAGGVITTIAVDNARTVVANQNGSQLLVFSDSNDSDSVTVLTPGLAVPPVDLSCKDPNNPTPNAVCSVVSGFNRPVYAIINGTTAYVLNCGFECHGTQQASVQTLDLTTLAVGTPVPVNGATIGFLSGTKLYVAGLGIPNGPPCSSLSNSANPQTTATFCGTLDVVDLTTMTDLTFTSPLAIPDGYHDRMDMSINGQLFVGSRQCQDIGNVNNPSGEVRGCLAIYNTNTGALVIPPDNGDVNGLQSFSSRNVEYVAEGGLLRVYDTTKDVLLIDDFLPLGTITVIGYVGDIKAIDFF